MSPAFSDIATLLLACALVGALFIRLRQPALIAYIAVGIAAGSAGGGWIDAPEQIHLLAQIGVAVLLFVVGLKLDLHHVRHIGPVALATGLGQLAFTIVIGFALVLALGRGVLESLYVAVALTFSSTIIIVKLLSDKRELDALHGRIAVGFLIVQDVAVVIATMAMSTAGGAGCAADAGAMTLIATLIGKLIATGVLMYLLMRWLLPVVTAAMARSQELLLVFAVAWGVALAALGDWAGFSREAGAFLAGFSLASTPWREAMHARLTGFLAGLTVAQISEFSIVFVAMGISLGHVDARALGLTTLVGLVTITISTYMILYSQPLYERLAPWLRVFERRLPFRELDRTQAGPDGAYEVVIFGLGRYGCRLLQRLHGAGVRTLGVDFDPEAVRARRAHDLPVRYGDAQDRDFVESLPMAGVRRIVSTLPDWESDRQMLHALQDAGYRGEVTATARPDMHACALRRAGVAHVLAPYLNAADHAAQLMLAELRPDPPPASAVHLVLPTPRG